MGRRLHCVADGILAEVTRVVRRDCGAPLSFCHECFFGAETWRIKGSILNSPMVLMFLFFDKLPDILICDIERIRKQ